MPTSLAEPDTSNAAFEDLYEDAPCGYVSTRTDGTIIRANRTVLRSLGHAAETVLGRSFRDMLAIGSRIYFETHWGPRLLLEGGVREVAVDLLRADGTRMPVLLNATVRGEGDARVVHASLFDASDRRRYERTLVAVAEQQAAVARLGADALEGAPLGALFATAAAMAQGNLPAERVLAVRAGEPAPALGDAEPAMRVPIGSVGAPVGELVVVAEPETLVDADRSFLRALANVLATAVERQRVDDATRHRALHDPLTGLGNRLLLQDRLAAAVAEAGRSGTAFSVCLLDLDDFKIINDTLGHQAGDEVLRVVGDRLAAVVGSRDATARLGGDEFVVVCELSGDHGAAEALAQRLLDALGRPLTVGGREHVLAASVGVVVGGGEADPDAMLRDADVAMYQAKAAGRGRWARFDGAMRAEAHERLRTEVELRSALREGQLRVHYQPVIDAARGGRMTSMEALVRWEHPERGLLAPGAFMPVAEQSGLVVELGRVVLRAACERLAAWRREGVVGLDVGVAVNVSGRQLADPGFPGEVARVLRETGLEATPHLVGLEITETVLMSDETPARVLAALADIGVELLLDDFGTGASSLARLKRFPVHTLKIDRAFVTGLGQGDGTDDAIVGAIVSLAGALGLRVIAEGVETDGQLRQLRTLDCERIQGFLYSKPLAPEVLRARLEAGELG